MAWGLRALAACPHPPHSDAQPPVTPVQGAFDNCWLLRMLLYNKRILHFCGAQTDIRAGKHTPFVRFSLKRTLCKVSS